ncbi:apolipoprotein D-like [Belonocnema kinseyi]|uniref:apolipoprotein D-like n=1 Tax=Belonocnema kinseyi TaxID=2817044 RepID=UPI00143D365A|nr:apolipoprotein D-like [Belonocnema kinseyi]
MIQVGFLVLLCAGAFANPADDQPCANPPYAKPYANPPNLKPCAGVTPMKKFNLTKNNGKWYVVEKYAVAYNWNQKCLSKYFEDRKGDNKTSVPKIRDGFAKFVESEAGFTEHYKGVEHEEQWILDTDYKTYAVHFACGDLSPNGVNNVWIMAKTIQSDAEVLKKAYKVLKYNNLSVEILEEEDWLLCA